MLLGNRRIAWIATAGVAMVCGGAARAGDAPEYARLIESKSPAVVMIKLVMKMKFGGQDREQEAEISGLMIDSKGLILCANDDLNPVATIRRRLGPRAGEFSATPSDLKVLIGDDNEGVEAKVQSTDTELDLAWVQIKEPKGPYAFVDFAKSCDGKIGQRILAIHRLPKYFDRHVIVDEGRIGGITAKPRRLYVPTAGMQNGSGFPVFAADGNIIGFAILQLPDEGEEGGMGQTALQGMILPAAEVVKATQRAKETPDKPAPAAKDNKADAKKEKPATKGDKPDPAGAKKESPKSDD